MKRSLQLILVPVILIGAVIIGQSIVGQSSVKNPHGKLDWDCQDCHSTSSWSDIKVTDKFDHAKTGFALLGAHATAQCIGCHKDPVFSHVGVSCADCHADHHNGQLGADCQNCHTPRDWQNRRDVLDLHAARGFALTGVHAVADCEACHSGHPQQQYAGAPLDCYGCHADAYASTTEPNHAQSGFSNDCRECHQVTATSWHDAKINHPASFPLTGGHAGVPCRDCHSSGYANTSSDCYSCHSTQFAATTDPDHEAGSFPHDCRTCHTTISWQPAFYDHSATSFPLTGAHRQVACIQCHATQYAGTPTACYSCHQTAFEQVTDPNHVTGNFDHNCTVCHTTTAWSPSTFDHSSTGFALTGAHLSANCSACHSSGFSGTPSDCYSCHQTAFEQVTDPNHVTNNFDHNCTTCHSTTAWLPSTFDHSATTFPLTGAHLSTTCISCHGSGFAGTPTACYSCHQTAFEQVTDPNHVTNNFDHNCATCHGTTAWLPSTFDHSATIFPLTGAHLSTTCISCHGSGFAGTPTACYSCHQTAFEQVTDPNHVTGNFDHNCALCHTTAAFTPASFDHSTTSFPLTGKHLTATCISCHGSGFTSTPTACYACHQTAYAGTTDPNHTAAGFPTTCETCHTTNGWTPSTWDHDALYFPIYSGAHNGVWNSCADCHVNQSSFAVFECINCHQHNKTDTDAHHTGVSNYQYLSTACYSCHPRGRH